MTERIDSGGQEGTPDGRTARVVRVCGFLALAACVASSCASSARTIGFSDEPAPIAAPDDESLPPSDEAAAAPAAPAGRAVPSATDAADLPVATPSSVATNAVERSVAATAESPRNAASAEDAPPTAAPAGEPATVRPGLLIRVDVFASGKKEVEEPLKRVSAAGTIALPLVGTIKVEGLTTEVLTERLTALYAEYIRNPTVEVGFQEETEGGELFPWGHVTVLGRVKKPGRVAVPPTGDLTLSMAIQRAGGQDTSAKETGIRVTRRSDNGSSKQFDVNLRNVGARGAADEDIPLKPGDIVFVPERTW